MITRRAAAAELDEVYPVFGELVEGQEVLDWPRRGAVLKRVRIVRVGREARRYLVEVEESAELRAQVAEELLRGLRKRDEEVAAEFLRRWPDAIPTDSGLLHVVYYEGAGPTPDFVAKTLLRYSGFLIDGTQFGSSSSEPTEFTIGAVVKGLEEMLLVMRKGG